MKISIIEPNSKGHCYTYVRHVAAAAEQLGVDYTIHCTEIGRKSDDYSIHLGHICENRIDTSLSPLSTGRLTIYREINRIIDQVISSAKPDVVVYPTADFAAVAAGLGRLTRRSKLASVHSICLMTKLGFSYPNTDRKTLGWIEQLGLALSPWDHIGMIDVVAYERLHSRQHTLSARLKLFPDPIFIAPLNADQRQCRIELGWDLDRHLFVCPGVIRAGKGIAELVEGYLRLPQTAKTGLIFVGPVRDDLRRLFNRPDVRAEIDRQRIIVIDRVSTEKQFAQAFCAADVVCCVYPNQNHPSSIAITSLGYNRPVIYSHTLWIGEIGPRFQIGYSCDPTSPESISAAMIESIENKKDWKRSRQAERLLEFQSAKNFVNHWKDTLRSIDNPGFVGSAIPWHDVESKS